MCRMNLLLSFVNLCVQEFFEFVCVVSQKRRIELEDNKDHFSFLLLGNNLPVTIAKLEAYSKLLQSKENQTEEEGNRK
jgi:hypothetical protein